MYLDLKNFVFEKYKLLYISILVGLSFYSRIGKLIWGNGKSQSIGHLDKFHVLSSNTSHSKKWGRRLKWIIDMA